MSYLPILTYHRVIPDGASPGSDPHRLAVTQSLFRRHLAWLNAAGYHAVCLRTYPMKMRIGETYPPRSFAITFDDAYEDVLTTALPVLQEFGWTALVFVVSGALGGVNHWDGGSVRLLDASQLKRLLDVGVAIGAHTVTHPHLPALPPAQARREIWESRKGLENALGEPIRLFAYPYGESSPDLERAVQEAGFEMAFATDRAPWDHTAHPFCIRRVVVFPKTSPAQVLLKVQSWYPKWQDWKRK